MKAKKKKMGSLRVLCDEEIEGNAAKKGSKIAMQNQVGTKYVDEAKA